MAIKTITHLVLSATLLAGAALATNASVPTHAAPAASRGARCVFPCVPANPTLSLYSHYGTVYISGTQWTPNRDINIDIYMPVSAGGAVYHTWAYVDAHGTFSTTWLAPHGCFMGQVEVQAYFFSDPSTVRTSYVVPGCIG